MSRRLSDLAAACDAASRWPLPGAGHTLARWQALAEMASADLVLARLAEAHADAVAICAELGGEQPRPEQLWGVWAAEGPASTLTFDGERLSGSKPWCSGATVLTHALVTAKLSDGDTPPVLCAVALDQAEVQPGADDWAWPGMRGADTRTVHFRAARAVDVGPPGAYLARPGFWLGGMGVAACWYGGTAALAAPLRAHVARHPESAHAAAHLGAVDVVLGAAGAALREAAALVDAAPSANHEQLARRVRAAVADGASDVARRVGRALGPGPYAGDRAHARRVADLEVYVRQEHAEADLAILGALAAGRDTAWRL